LRKRKVSGLLAREEASLREGLSLGTGTVAGRNSTQQNKKKRKKKQKRKKKKKDGHLPVSTKGGKFSS